MTTHIHTQADTQTDPVRRLEPYDDTYWAVVGLDPDVEALLAEVEAIVSAALRTGRRPPPPPTSASAVRGVGSVAGRSKGVPAHTWRVPAHPVRAVPRSPPRPTTGPNKPRHVRGR